MNTTVLTIYVLMWPLFSALVLLALAWGVWRDMRAAKRNGEHLV
ncbi:MAG TPA: putative transporter small subunit [Burkholderiaceae bacterium]|nr:putative transporter small subunit [Burkholderiaceae bacterium]